MRVQLLDDFFQSGAAARGFGQVVAADLGHAADAYALVEAGDGHLVGLVQDGRGGRHVRVGDGQGQRVALQGVYRQVDAQRREHLRGVAAKGQHVAVGVLELAVDAHAGDARAGRFKRLQRGAEAEFHPGRLRLFRQSAGEQGAVAGLVERQAQRSGQLVDHAGQGRLHAHDAGPVEDLVGHAVLLEHGDVLAGGIQLRLGAEQLHRTQLPAFVVQSGLFAQPVQAVAAVARQAHHACLVDRVAAGRAVAQHVQQPGVLVRVQAGLYDQRRVLGEQPFQGFQRHARRGPRRRVAGRDLAGVGKAGFAAGSGFAVHHGHLEAGARQVPRGAHADDATAQNKYVHWIHASPAAGRVPVAVSGSFAGAPGFRGGEPRRGWHRRGSRGRCLPRLIRRGRTPAWP